MPEAFAVVSLVGKNEVIVGEAKGLHAADDGRGRPNGASHWVAGATLGDGVITKVALLVLKDDGDGISCFQQRGVVREDAMVLEEDEVALVDGFGAALAGQPAAKLTMGDRRQRGRRRADTGARQ